MKEKPEIRRKSKPLKIHDEAVDVFDPEIADSYSNQEALDVLNFDHENHIRKSKGGQEENFKEMLVHSITRVSSKS